MDKDNKDQTLDAMDDENFDVEEQDESEAQQDQGEESGAPNEEQEQDRSGSEEQEADGSEETLFELQGENGSARSVTREQLLELAAQGQQVAGLRQQIGSLTQERDQLNAFRNENSAVISELRQLAEVAGVSIMDYLGALQENLLVSQGMKRDAAKNWVQRQRNQAQAREQQASQARAQQQAAQQRQNADIQAFLTRWPNVDPKTIPQTVWDAVRNGDTLVSAYASHELTKTKEENKRLTQQLAAREKNGSNHAAAVGSVKTSGSKTTIDPFLQGFNAE